MQADVLIHHNKKIMLNQRGLILVHLLIVLPLFIIALLLVFRVSADLQSRKRLIHSCDQLAEQNLKVLKQDIQKLLNLNPPARVLNTTEKALKGMIVAAALSLRLELAWKLYEKQKLVRRQQKALIKVQNALKAKLKSQIKLTNLQLPQKLRSIFLRNQRDSQSITQMADFKLQSKKLTYPLLHDSSQGTVPITILKTDFSQHLKMNFRWQWKSSALRLHSRWLNNSNLSKGGCAWTIQRTKTGMGNLAILKDKFSLNSSFPSFVF